MLPLNADTYLRDGFGANPACSRLVAGLGGRSDAGYDVNPDVEKLVLRYAVVMTQTPVEVSDEIFNGLRVHFNEKQMVELTAVIAWENYRARFDHAFGVESMGFTEGAFCPLPEKRQKE